MNVISIYTKRGIIMAKTKEHIQDNGQDEKQMIAEGYLPIYDDGQTLIY